MFIHTITLYNQGVNQWHRSVLRGVHWESFTGSTLRKTGVKPKDGVQLIIPRSVPGYVKPKAWDALVDKTGSWTLKGGDKAVPGEHPEVASTKDFAAMDDVITITVADDLNFGGMAHLEVTGA